MKIVIAPDSFKRTLSASRVCEIIAEATQSVCPKAELIKKPIADGGEGTAQALMTACDGQWISKRVTGPLPDMVVDAGYVWFEQSRTALVEMACASGMILLSSQQLNPLLTTTYGTGQLIKAATEKQPDQILLAIGGSATVDCGVGAAMALEWQFLDGNGKTVGLGGGELDRIEKIIAPNEKFLPQVKVLSDVTNPLLGHNGAARVFAPQKGADCKTVDRLEQALLKLSKLIQAELEIDVADMPGAGAAGGLGAGAVAFMSAQIVSGIETVIEFTNLGNSLQGADWVITGEGKFDAQSLNGKVVSGIANLARKMNVKVAVLAGDVQLKASEYMNLGITDAISCKKEDMSIGYALDNCEELLSKTAKELAKKHLI